MQEITKFKCRLCGFDKVLIKYKINSCKIGRCKKCSFVQVLKRPTKEEILDLYSDVYFKRGKYVNDKAIDLENKRRIFWLKKNGIKKGAKILDVGCATGDFIKAAKNEFDIWGTDVSGFAIRQARLANPEISSQIQTDNIESPRFPDIFFDAIVLWDVIEHLWDPSNTILKLSKVLKPGGLIVISTPNIGALAARLMGKYWHFMTVPEHLCFFNKKTIFYLAETNRFKPVSWMTRGKWINIGFLLYKINKVLPKILSANFVQCVQNKNNLASIVVYVPSGDIQYLAAKKL